MGQRGPDLFVGVVVTSGVGDWRTKYIAAFDGSDYSSTGPPITILFLSEAAILTL